MKQTITLLLVSLFSITSTLAQNHAHAGVCVYDFSQTTTSVADYYASLNVSNKLDGTLDPPVENTMQIIFNGSPGVPDEEMNVATWYFDGFTDSDLAEMQTNATVAADEFLLGIEDCKEWWRLRAVYTTVPHPDSTRYNRTVYPNNVGITRSLLFDDVVAFSGSVNPSELLFVIVNSEIFAGNAYPSFFSGIPSYAVLTKVVVASGTLHEASHIGGPGITKNAVAMAQDEYPFQGMSTAVGYNVKFYPSEFAPFIAAGGQPIYGYGYAQDAYVMSESYMRALSLPSGEVMHNYWLNVSYFGVGDIISSTSHPNHSTINVSGFTDTISVAARLCATHVYEWRINGLLVETNRTGIFAPIYSLYTDPVTVEMTIVDNNPAIVDTTHIRTWTRSWTVVPDNSPLGTIAVEFSLTDVDTSEQEVTVEWEVTLQNGIKEYVVEASYDDENFSRAGTVTADPFMPNNGVRTYQYVHTPDCEEPVRYRIQVKDIGQRFLATSDTSNTVATVCKAVGVSPVALQAQVKVYPNPVRTILHLDWEQPFPVTGVILNAIGQVVQEDIQVTPGINYLDVRKYTTGVYFLRVSDGSTDAIRILVQQ